MQLCLKLETWALTPSANIDSFPMQVHRSLHPNRWRAWWMRKSWSWCSARNFVETQRMKQGCFCHQMMGLLCFNEVCRIRRTIQSWRILLMIWSDFTWEFEVWEQNVGADLVGFGCLSKAKFTIDVADPALCMTDSTSVIYLFLHVAWTQRLSNESAFRHGDCGPRHTLRYRVRAVCLEGNMQYVLLG